MKLHGKNPQSLEKLVTYANSHEVSPQGFNEMALTFLESIADKGVTHIKIGDIVYQVKAKKVKWNERKIF